MNGKLSELKTTIDVGQHHWSSVVQAISHQFEPWNNSVNFTCLCHITYLLSYGIPESYSVTNISSKLVLLIDKRSRKKNPLTIL